MKKQAKCPDCGLKETSLDCKKGCLVWVDEKILYCPRCNQTHHISQIEWVDAPDSFQYDPLAPTHQPITIPDAHGGE